MILAIIYYVLRNPSNAYCTNLGSDIGTKLSFLRDPVLGPSNNSGQARPKVEMTHCENYGFITAR